MERFDKLFLDFLARPSNVVLANLALVAIFFLVVYRKPVGLVFKNVRRSPLRSMLTSLATVAFVFMVTLVWTILWTLDRVTTEKSKDFKAIVTERWQIPSQMPFAYATTLSEGAASQAADVRPVDSMTWQFFGGTIDKDKRTFENLVFFFGMEPAKLLTMMDGIDEFTEEQVSQLRWAIGEMEKDKRKVLIGAERLQKLNKKIGERIKLYSINFKDVELEVEIIAELPAGRYGQSGVMNRDYLNDTFEAWPRGHAGQAHPQANKTLNLVWLKVPDTPSYQRLAEQILTSPLYAAPAVKCETASSGIATFLDAYRDFLWILRWLLVPAILAAMSAITATAISFSVRERRTEMAVLKVLGFGPNQVFFLILGEAVLVGVISGFLSAAVTYFMVNLRGGIPFPIAFFPVFRIPADALWWGPALGGVTALIGSCIPAWMARSVKAAEVFAKVT